MKYTAVVLGFVVVMMALVYGLDVLFVWMTTYVFGVPAPDPTLSCTTRAVGASGAYETEENSSV